jgi:hypothetical protein
MCWLLLQCVVLLSFMYINHVHAICEGQDDCHATDWMHWSNCSLTCGVRFRQKALCCSVKQPTFENCLKHCNLTEICWWANSYEQDTCNTSCTHGPYGDKSYQCKCIATEKYHYSCETGKTIYF